MLACSACGASVTYYRKRNRAGQVAYRYWFCRNRQCSEHVCTREELVHEKLVANASAEVARRVSSGTDLEHEPKRLRASLAKSKAELERLLGLFGDGEIDRDSLASQQAKVKRDADATTMKLRAVEAALAQ